MIGAPRAVSLWNAGRRDPFRPNRTLLLHCDGTNGSTTFTDSSPSPKSITQLAAGATISTAQSKFGGSGINFNGTGYIGNSSDTTIYGFGTGDFTMQCWVRGAFSANGVIFDGRYVVNTTAPTLIANSGGTVSIYYNGALILTTSTAIPANTWTHLAWVRSSGTSRVYIGGTLATGGSAVDTNNYVPLSCLIGATGYTPLGAVGFVGDLDEISVSKAAEWTANFTPPALPFPNF